MDFEFNHAGFCFAGHAEQIDLPDAVVALTRFERKLVIQELQGAALCRGVFFSFSDSTASYRTIPLLVQAERASEPNILLLLQKDTASMQRGTG